MRTLRVLFFYKLKNKSNDQYVDTIFINTDRIQQSNSSKFSNRDIINAIKNGKVFNHKHKKNIINIRVASFKLYDLDSNEIQFLTNKPFNEMYIKTKDIII